MNVIDSSFWLEYYSDTKYADYISEVLVRMKEVVVPTIVVVEVFKKLITVSDETTAIIFVTQMRKGIIAELNYDLSLDAAYLGKEYKLPLADSIIYATTLKYNATLYTLDKHFKGLKNVQFYEK